MFAKPSTHYQPLSFKTPLRVSEGKLFQIISFFPKLMFFPELIFSTLITLLNGPVKHRKDIGCGAVQLIIIIMTFGNRSICNLFYGTCTHNAHLSLDMGLLEISPMSSVDRDVLLFRN
jgi:hypothetical protein